MNFAQYPSLSGRVVFVTGGASGIGADIVRAFAATGSKVAFVDIQDEVGQALADELAGSAHRPIFRRCDLTDTEATQAVIAEIGRELGPIGVLVNNAANDDRREVDDVTPDYWDWSQSINLRPQFFTAQAVRPQMRELGYGSIINFSSIAWRGGAPNMPAYTTAKAAVLGLTRSLARAFGADNIRVNSIEPGAVMTEKQYALWYKTPESVDALVSRQCIRTVLRGEEIARTALFLGADDSRMITKQSIIVDGGLS
ncbi:SDR family NAD(P)-dependent oxidoreductase [Kaistia granuli]|uniref:SDR family NAD(P)-dependent oxidoreductase n=1 Tax=Kaistia granuli TaxID=363259 RepID=UPI00036049E9|nr:SDR family oxidoreductase [Kaistia granuli]